MTTRTQQDPPASGPCDPTVPGANLSSRTSILAWVLILAPIGYLWFRLINNLRLEWATNPQYGYGGLVPFLCLGLLIRRWQSYLPANHRPLTSAFPLPAFLFAVLALLYLPTRLIEAAVPEWRPIQWLLGTEAIGLTLCVVWMGKGRGWLRQLAFPILFFFVAIPWPSMVEIPIIQTLTRASAAIVIEMLNLVGVPAMAHGNLIEVGTGVVGIDEACSGIRSFQSSLMISLFLGEFYGLSRFRRLLLMPIGFGLSMALNIGRMFLLTLLAAKKGVSAIGQYHDPAGITIAITCTLALWGVAVWLKSRQLKKRTDKSRSISTPNEASSPALILPVSPSNMAILNRFAVSLIVWLVLVEVGVELWYRRLESHLQSGPVWSLNFPRSNSSLKDLPISADTRYLLRFDDGKQAAWTESDGTQWQVFYFNWFPGRVAGYLAKRHTPEICLRATGCKMLSGPTLAEININGVDLPIRSYVFETASGPIYVFHCRWEGGAKQSAHVEQESARFNLVRGIWAGRGNHGQKILEVILSGYTDAASAKTALVRQLPNMIKVEKTQNLAQTVKSTALLKFPGR